MLMLQAATSGLLKAKNTDIEIIEDNELRNRAVWYHEYEMQIDRRNYQRELLKRQDNDFADTGKRIPIKEYCKVDGKKYEDYFDEWENPIETDIKFIKENVCEDTMKKWIVDFIIGRLTLFHHTAHNIRNMYGGEYATSRMKIALLERISEFYPKYKEECIRQKEELIREIRSA